MTLVPVTSKNSIVVTRYVVVAKTEDGEEYLANVTEDLYRGLKMGDKVHLYATNNYPLLYVDTVAR